MTSSVKDSRRRKWTFSLAGSWRFPGCLVVTHFEILACLTEPAFRVWHYGRMPPSWELDQWQEARRARNNRTTPAAAAVRAMRIALGEVAESLGESPAAAKARGRTPKNPAAVALGKLGGKRGGRARADKLSADERREIARRAAVARWRNDG